MKISTTMIKELREATGAGVLEVKKALEAHEGNFEKAAKALREKGLAKAAKRAGRKASEGLIEVYAHPGSRVGVLVELNSETDFVARNDKFKTLAHDVALHVAAMAPKYLSREDVPPAVLENELSVLRTQALAEGKPEAIVEKIIAGRIEKFYADNCLLEQPFVKDDSRTVNDLVDDARSSMGEHIVLSRFIRYQLGEAL